MAQPKPLATGVKLNVPVALGLVYVTVGVGIRAGLLETAVTLSVSFSLAAPELMPVGLTVCGPASSSSVTALNASRVGGSLTGLTVTPTVPVALPPWLSLII